MHDASQEGFVVSFTIQRLISEQATVILKEGGGWSTPPFAVPPSDALHTVDTFFKINTMQCFLVGIPVHDDSQYLLFTK
jgi:hypothetical protein